MRDPGSRTMDAVDLKAVKKFPEIERLTSTNGLLTELQLSLRSE